MANDKYTRVKDDVFLQQHSLLLCQSYRHWTGQDLLLAEPGQLVSPLMQAPFAVVSHDTQDDPIFNYANLRAQQLFVMDWHQITVLPSRLSAEAMLREERAMLLERVQTNGYIDDYCGVRIASDGSRFTIRNATVWNLIDSQGRYCGQAAKFDV